MSNPIHLFDNSDETPRPLEEVRITEVQVEVLPDGRRVLVSVHLTPFFEKPNFDVTLLRDEVEARSLSVVGAMDTRTELTMHLPAGDASGTYVARIDLLGEDAVRQSERVTFEVGKTLEV